MVYTNYTVTRNHSRVRGVAGTVAVRFDSVFVVVCSIPTLDDMYFFKFKTGFFSFLLVNI